MKISRARFQQNVRIITTEFKEILMQKNAQCHHKTSDDKQMDVKKAKVSQKRVNSTTRTSTD